MEGMFSYAVDCIKTAYPNVRITRNYAPSNTRGEFQIHLKNKDGKETEIYNKNKKDGSFSEISSLIALERIKKQVENP